MKSFSGLAVARRADSDPVAIIPFRKDPRTWMTVVARTRMAAMSLGNAFRHGVPPIDPDLPVRNLMTLDSQLAQGRWQLTA